MTVEEISLQEAQKRVEEGSSILIDVREPDEFAMVRIDGAVNIPVSQFDIGAVLNAAGGKNVIFHCKMGKRAENMWHVFTTETGHPATCMTGSIMAWIDEGLPVLTES